MSIGWDEKLPVGGYVLTEEDFANKEYGFTAFIASKLKNYIQESLFKNPVNKNHYSDVDQINLNNDVNLRFQITKSSYEFCCIKSYRIPLIGFSPTYTKIDFLYQLFEIGNSTLTFTDTTLLKEVLLCGSDINRGKFYQYSYYQYIQKKTIKWTFKHIAGNRKLTEKSSNKIWDLSCSYAKSICKKEVLEVLNHGFSIEIEDKALLSTSSISEMDWKMNTKKFHIKMNYDEFVKRFARVISTKDHLGIEAGILKISINDFKYADIIIPIQNQTNTSVKAVYHINKETNHLQYETPHKTNTFNCNKNPLGYLHKVYVYQYYGLMDALYRREISSDDKERSYSYYVMKDLDDRSNFVRIDSIKVSLSNKKKELYKEKFKPEFLNFSANSLSEKQATIYGITNLLFSEKYKPTFEEIEKIVQTDIQKIIENPPDKKQSRIRAGKNKKFQELEMSIETFTYFYAAFLKGQFKITQDEFKTKMLKYCKEKTYLKLLKEYNQAHAGGNQ